jgi:nucleoside-diphosphate-sugar epimerase
MATPNPARDRVAPGRVLVTGGAGFIGSHLVEHLVGRGHAVTVVDDLSTGRSENLAAVVGRVDLIGSDLSEALPVLRARPAFDAVYHLAAAVGVDLVLSELLAVLVVLVVVVRHHQSQVHP